MSGGQVEEVDGGRVDVDAKGILRARCPLAFSDGHSRVHRELAY